VHITITFVSRPKDKHFSFLTQKIFESKKKGGHILSYIRLELFFTKNTFLLYASSRLPQVEDLEKW